MTETPEIPIAPAPPWYPPMQAEVFPVRFGEGGIFGHLIRPGDSLQMVGEGVLSIGPDGIVLTGKRRDFLSTKPEAHVFGGGDITNVVGSGTEVVFRIPQLDGVPRSVRLNAADDAAAQRIVSLLPVARSAEFSAQMVAFAEFRERLQAVSRPALVTPVLVALNVLMFVAMAFDGAGLLKPDGEVAVRWGSDYGPLTLSGQWWRLFTATFIHFGILHLGLNMLALYQTGGMTERLYGRGRFLALYVFSGLTGSLASLLWNPDVNGAGASGAIFGVFGGVLAFLMNPRNGVPATVMTQHRNSTLLFAGYSLLFGATHSGIDNAAHIGGLLGGFLMGLLLARPVDVAARAKPATARLLLSAGVAVLVLGAMMTPLLNPSDEVRQQREFRASLTDFQTRELAALALMNRAAREIERNQDAAEYSRLMREAAAGFEGLKRDVDAYRLRPGSDDAIRQGILSRYVEARVRLCRAAALAVTGDAAANAEAEQASKDADAALEELN